MKKKTIPIIAILVVIAFFYVLGTSGEDKEVDDTSNNISTKTVDKRATAVGTSNKNFRDISTQEAAKVRNDVTGNWRIVTISDNVKIEEYALSYYKNNFKEDKEIHAIVNFTLNTTTKIVVIGDCLKLTTYEYIDNEEHDAKALFGGMELSQYNIYKDNGDIELIK